MSQTNLVKPSYELRLTEAKELIQNGHYRPAVESASGGIELLMQELYAELREYLNHADFNLQSNLRTKYKEVANRDNRNGEMTFGSLIIFYQEADVIDELVAAFRYEFVHFNKANLYTINQLRNRCVHDNYQPNSEEAVMVYNHLAMFLTETARQPKPEESKQDSIASWRDAWRQEWDERIHDWITQFADSPQAELLSALTDLLMLVTGLVADNRIDYPQKSPLLMTVNYVICPADLIPEEIEGVPGLLDDVAILTFTLHRFIQSVEIDSAILRDHWDREDPPLEFIDNMQKYIHENHDKLFEDDIWTKLRQVANNGMAALWNNAPEEENNGNARIHNIYQFISEEECATNDDWYKKWRKRIDEWAKNNVSSDIATIVLAVPDLFVLVTNLMRDSRVSSMIKARLLAASAYVVSPFDLIPEGLVGVIGLTDDAGALALIGFWIINIVSIDEEILRDHWPGDSDPITVINDLHNKFTVNAEALFGNNPGIWKNLQERFGKKHDANRGGIRAVIRRIFGKSET